MSAARELVAVGGVVLMAAGIGWVYAPAALIFAGLVMLLLATRGGPSATVAAVRVPDEPKAQE
jgi:hypothetical protein